MQIFDFPETIFWQIFEKFKKILSCFTAGAQSGGAFGAFAPQKFSKHCIASLTFVETFKE